MDSGPADDDDRPTLPDVEDWITIGEAAELVGRDRMDIYVAMRDGDIRGLLRGEPREWRVDRTSLTRWAAR